MCVANVEDADKITPILTSLVAKKGVLVGTPALPSQFKGLKSPCLSSIVCYLLPVARNTDFAGNNRSTVKA